MGTDETSRVEASVTGEFEELLEGVIELSLMPVKTLVTEDSLEMGKGALDDGVGSEMLSSPGVTVTVTIGFSVTVTAPESQDVEPTASTLELSGLPA